MFERLSIPTPFQVGPVNAYLAGRTIVDPGPDSEEAWAALLDGLDARDMTPEDVEQVLVTHPHPDHFGLAHRLRSAGARVIAGTDATPIIEDFPGRLQHEQTYFQEFFERCGMDRTTARTVTDLPDAFLSYAPSVTVDRSVEAGDSVVAADTTLTVDTLTGHARGEILFAYHDDGDRVGIVGDNVLGTITPNPFLLPPEALDEERPRVLPAYNRSLDRLREAAFDRFLPGHRETIEDPAQRIDEIRAAHEDRTAAVAEIVDHPTTPVEVMHELFGDLPATEAFSGMSEAVGHLDVLAERGAVTAVDRGGMVVFEPDQ